MAAKMATGAIAASTRTTSCDRIFIVRVAALRSATAAGASSGRRSRDEASIVSISACTRSALRALACGCRRRLHGVEEVGPQARGATRARTPSDPRRRRPRTVAPVDVDGRHRRAGGARGARLRAARFLSSRDLDPFRIARDTRSSSRRRRRRRRSHTRRSRTRCLRCRSRGAGSSAPAPSTRFTGPTRSSSRSSVWIACVSSTPPASRAIMPRPGSAKYSNERHQRTVADTETRSPSALLAQLLAQRDRSRAGNGAGTRRRTCGRALSTSSTSRRALA